MWLLASTLAAPPPCGPPRTAPPTSLREVDWCNRDYQQVGGPMRAGESEYHEWELDQSGHSTTIGRLVTVLHTADTAWVVLSSETWLYQGHTWADGTAVVFAWKDGAAVEIARGHLPRPTAATLDGDALVVSWEETGPVARSGRWVRDGAKVVPEPKRP